MKLSAPSTSTLVVVLALIASWALPSLGADLFPGDAVADPGGLTWQVVVLGSAKICSSAAVDVAKELHAAATELAKAIKAWNPGTVKFRIERTGDEWDGKERREHQPRAIQNHAQRES